MASRRERKDPMGIGLAVLNRVAQSPLIDRLGLREVTEKAIYQGTKTGFRAASSAGRTFKKVQARGAGTRQEKVGDSGVFDLHPTEDQQMIVDVVRQFGWQQRVTLWLLERWRRWRRRTKRTAALRFAISCPPWRIRWVGWQAAR